MNLESAPSELSEPSNLNVNVDADADEDVDVNEDADVDEKVGAPSNVSVATTATAVAAGDVHSAGNNEVLNNDLTNDSASFVTIDVADLRRIVEGLLLASSEPLSLDYLYKLLHRQNVTYVRDVTGIANSANAGNNVNTVLDKSMLRVVIGELARGYQAEHRAFELKEVASGYRLQVCQDLASWVHKLWEEKPPRYSRAFLETLAIIAYKQPVTRAEIEDVRGVSVSSNTVKTLMEHGWVKIVGYKEVPGRPALYATTSLFLDYFNLRSLEDLPPIEDDGALLTALNEEGMEKVDVMLQALVSGEKDALLDLDKKSELVKKSEDSCE